LENSFTDGIAHRGSRHTRCLVASRSGRCRTSRRRTKRANGQQQQQPGANPAPAARPAATGALANIVAGGAIGITVHADGTIHRHYPRHRRNPRFYTYYDPFYSPFGYGYGYGYPYYGASAALYYNGYRPQQYRRSGGSVVVGVQRGLAAAGYYRGAVDGVFGPQTGAAIRAFERDNGLRVDGQIDNRLLGTLGVR
jgi:hypothetical protein